MGPRICQGKPKTKGALEGLYPQKSDILFRFTRGLQEPSKWYPKAAERGTETLLAFGVRGKEGKKERGKEGKRERGKEGNKERRKEGKKERGKEGKKERGKK